jgi:hypothetical protein
MRVPVIAGLLFAVTALAPCAAKHAAGDYAAAPAAFEHGGSDRTSLFAAPDPFASEAAPEQSHNPALRGLWNVAEAEDGSLFALSGVLGGRDRPTVSSLNAADLAIKWQRELPLPPTGGKWNYPGAVAVHANGQVYAIYMTRLARLDPATGEVTATVDLPAPNGLDDTTYNGFIILEDGMILAKSHHRPKGCTAQGYRAFVECGVEGVAPSALMLIDPETLRIVWTGSAPELIGGRITATRFRGQTYVYLAGHSLVHRMVYRGARLESDAEWGPVRYRHGEQTSGTAVVGFGDFVLIQNNAIPTRAPLSLTAIAQGDASRSFTVQPFAQQTDHWYFMPSKMSTDWDNRRVYTAAAYDGLVALDFDPDGGFSVAWRKSQPTGSFITLVGPPEQRVLIAGDVSGAAPDTLGAPEHTREGLVWRNANDGRELYRLDDLPRNFGLTLTPDRDGAVVFPTRTEGLFKFRPQGQLGAEPND